MVESIFVVAQRLSSFGTKLPAENWASIVQTEVGGRQFSFLGRFHPLGLFQLLFCGAIKLLI